jgi:hypothetical protein
MTGLAKGRIMICTHLWRLEWFAVEARGNNIYDAMLRAGPAATAVAVW